MCLLGRIDCELWGKSKSVIFFSLLNMQVFVYVFNAYMYVQPAGPSLHLCLLCTGLYASAQSHFLPGVVVVPLSSVRAGPWLLRQRWAGLWHWSVPTSDEPWCCWPERLGLDWVSGGLGAWGTGTGPQGNLLLWEVKATCHWGEQINRMWSWSSGSERFVFYMLSFYLRHMDNLTSGHVVR